MADLVKRFFPATGASAYLGTSAATLYTAPASPAEPATVTTIRFQNNQTTEVTVTLSINADTGNKRLYDAFTLAAKSVHVERVEIGMFASETIQGFASVGSAVTCHITGVETS